MSSSETIHQTSDLVARRFGCLVFTEHRATAEVEVVATVALMRDDVLPAPAREPEPTLYGIPATGP